MQMRLCLYHIINYMDIFILFFLNLDFWVMLELKCFSLSTHLLQTFTGMLLQNQSHSVPFFRIKSNIYFENDELVSDNAVIRSENKR